MIKTAITEMFGIEYPVICGAMMWLCKPKLCAAISEAGGMGNITAGNYETEEDFRAAIREVRKITDKPFMIGLTLLPSIRITAEHHKMYVRVCAEERVAGIEVSGSPLDKVIGQEGIDRLKQAGVRLFHKVGSVRHAVHAEKVGYDGVYAAGFEEGGHPLDDDVTTMVLTPRIVDSVNIPVVTVGGISDGRSLAAALTLGAQGVMMASRFIATRECDVHENIKKELIDRQEFETTMFCKSLGLQGRALKNKVIGEVLEIENKGGGLEQLIPLISGQRIKDAWEQGLVEDAPLMVGQSIGHIRDIVSCRDLLSKMHDDAISHLAKAMALVK
ncbi:MAG: Nitronate monooxygenase [Deltaproteobacteria bacterium ADurb.BinA179]|jgi:nitronate monooxygenase|nr:nitronate monooxygenase [Pseudomonadota bacterium]NLW67631.1 nitronate monooxygenase [Bacteriovoracaceae bacterium]OPZ26195.1 MAG: Nitronate monooxygenase [Deltaproteobacteria bacterium ADurb.BinA179]HNR52199.1 nitronate monooxygenase [Deltaproteobacteria bacterium]HRR19873.1 nitronate monooxygenase [Desulfomonilia bacterium]